MDKGADDLGSDWDEERKALEERYIHDQAAGYIQHAKKNKDDTWYSGAPLKTPVDFATRAAITYVTDRTGISGHEIDKTTRKDLTDVVAEIFKQANAAAAAESLYERIVAIDEHPYKSLNNRLLVSKTGVVEMPQVREFLFDALIDTAIKHGEEPGNFTTVERCIRTARSVLDIIDGGQGNRPDGEGLPLLQLVLSPHPDYMEARARHHDQVEFGDTILDYGMLGPNNYQTGLARAFDNRFDERFAEQIESRTIRAARDLFKE
jgi:hypothetical protein